MPAPAYRGSDQPSSSSSTLVIRDLNPMTTEETLYTSLGVYGQLKEIKLLRDTVTQISKYDLVRASLSLSLSVSLADLLNSRAVL